MQDTAWLPKLAGIVVPEPTSLAVVTVHRGILWLQITTKGKAVHSSMPERGVNAVMHMKRVLDELERTEILTLPTANWALARSASIGFVVARR